MDEKKNVVLKRQMEKEGGWKMRERVRQRETERERERQTDRERERERDWDRKTLLDRGMGEDKESERGEWGKIKRVIEENGGSNIMPPC